ncbi:coth-domain-containing protein [Anaeromyces robustus]|uniref:Coth-domain-containing protein n=1 Tax=Anaeromyces robustus TaxID=1754192 RepID=A0A1Y1X2G3_9FUNG|nr:coth-domain-containing protein [Anaeromyces robustus]|eukprot:ORX79963.1 coth-domain-containing protein [Anaeromyces robustus]
MKIQYLNLALSSIVAVVNAASWKFNVVNIMGTDYDIGIKYNNKVTKMTTENFPLYTTTIESGTSKTYKYVLLDKKGGVVEEESFERTYSDSISNINEVYDRKNKNIQVTSIPRAYEPLYSAETSDFPIYPKNEIYTLYAKCDDETYTDLKHNPFLSGSHKNLNSSNCTISLVTPTESYQREGTLQLVGYNSRSYKKLSWKFKIDKKLFGRKTLKIRGLASDPTLLRDKLAAELFRSVGVPSYSGTYVRVMINEDVWGLYSIVDTIGGKWISSAIHGNKDAHTGFNYKMFSSVPNGPFASLRYLGNDPVKYETSGSYEVDETDKEDTESTNDFYRLIQFTKLFEDWANKYSGNQTKAAVEALEKFFDLESLLRQMVIESLTVAFDNFWAQSGNFAVYYNPEKNKYQIIPYDFDGTFYGSNGSPYYKSDYLTDCITWANNTPSDKYFVNHLMSHELIKKRYQEIMARVVDTVFNVDSLSPFIDSISELIYDDVEWNFNSIDDLDEEIPGHINHFTLQNFKDNINYKIVEYNSKINYNDAHYGIKQWIKVRGGYCTDYVNSILGNASERNSDPIPEPTTTTTVAQKKTTTTTTTVAPKKTTTTTTVAPKKTTTTTTVAPKKTTTTTTVAPKKTTTTTTVIATKKTAIQSKKPTITTSTTTIYIRRPTSTTTTTKESNKLTVTRRPNNRKVNNRKQTTTTTTTTTTTLTTTTNNTKVVITKKITLKKVVTITKVKSD